MVFLHKETVVLLLPKKVIITIGVVIDMVKGVELEHLYLFFHWPTYLSFQKN